MYKIKNFQFKILSSCTDNNMHMKIQKAHDEYESLYTMINIDKVINDFIADKDVKDIKITEIEQSNSGPDRTNIILLIYTIIYKEES